MKDWKIAIIISILLAVSGTIGVLLFEKDKKNDLTNDYFTLITECDNYSIVYDNETYVMYTVSDEWVFSQIVNADGTPKIYKPSKD